MLSAESLELMKEITEEVAVSGQERPLARLLEKHYKQYASEIIFDNLGSIYAIKKSKKADAPKVMVEAHMDEVGFIVKEIKSDGSIKVHNVGGFNTQTLSSNRVILVNKVGERFSGVITAIAPHLLGDKQKDGLKIADLVFDFGFSSKEDVLKANISQGDSIVGEGNFITLGNGDRAMAKAFDNRYGCILGIELLAALKDVDLDVDLYVGASVQEEVGLRGGQTSAQMIDPDLAIVLDCSPANDLGVDKKEGEIGNGVLIRIADAGMIAFKSLLKWQMESIEAIKGKYQYYISLGNTDASIIHKSNGGILTLTHCICARNLHTANSVIDLNDYETALKSLVHMLTKLDAKKISELKEGNR